MLGVTVLGGCVVGCFLSAPDVVVAQVITPPHQLLKLELIYLT